MTKMKKTTVIILAIIVVVMVATGITLKISYDNKVEQERMIAVQAQVELDEKAAEEARQAEQAEAEAAEAKVKEEARAKEAKEKAAKIEEEKKAATAKAEADKKAKEEAANKPTSSTPSGGNTSSTPTGGNTGGDITTGGDTSGGGTASGWQSYPGNLPNDQKKALYDLLKDFIGKSEPTGEYRDRLTEGLNGGIYSKVEWNSKIGMWEALDTLVGWELVCPVDGGGRSYVGYGLEQRR